MKRNPIFFLLPILIIAALSRNDANAAANNPVSVTLVLPSQTVWGSTANICHDIFIGSGGPSEIGGNAYLPVTSGSRVPVTYGPCQVGPFSMIPAKYAIEILLRLGSTQRGPLYAKAKVTAQSNGQKVMIKILKAQ